VELCVCRVRQGTECCICLHRRCRLPRTEAGLQARAARRHYWHASSGRCGSYRPSKRMVFWRGYVATVVKIQSPQRMYTGSDNPRSNREVVWDSPEANVVWLNERQDCWAIFRRGSNRNWLPSLWYVGTVCVPPGRGFAAERNLSSGRGTPPAHWRSYLQGTLTWSFPDRSMAETDVRWPPRSPVSVLWTESLLPMCRNLKVARPRPWCDFLSNADMLDRTWQETAYGLDLTHASSGSRVWSTLI
jgi:hypothetical protein